MGDITQAEQDGFAIGYVGPHIVNDKDCTLIIDPDARACCQCGDRANQKDHHVTGFNWARDLAAEKTGQGIVADVRNVVEGDIAPNGSGSRMLFRKAIEVGHVFKLGTKYSASMGASFLDENGKAASSSWLLRNRREQHPRRRDRAAPRHRRHLLADEHRPL
jgi:prolyl-tRNA synthetase